MTDSLLKIGVSLASLSALAVLLHGGCDIPPRPILQPVKTNTDPSLLAEADSADNPERFDAPAALEDSTWETWDAYFVGTKQVGYSHVTSAPVEGGADAEIRYVLDDRLYFNRGRARIIQRLTQTSYESRDGQLLRCEAQLQVGPAVTRFEGSMNDESEFVVETIRGTSRTVRGIPWSMSNRGLVGIEQSLRGKPMTEPGEQRRLKMLVPGRYELATATMRCAGEASVPMLDGELAKVIEINCELIDEEDEKTYLTIWTDFDGEVVRTYSSALQLIGYRTDEATATGFPGNELVAAAIGATGNQIERPKETVRVAYQVTSAGSDSELPTTIQPAPGQYVRTTDDGSFQVLVSRQDERLSGGFSGTPLEPSDGDLKPNFFIDHRATLVKRLAAVSVASDKMPNHDVALALTQTVNRSITPTDETLGFVKASEVARDGEGDSLAAAIMLAALLRSRKIPSRLAVGLKYAPPADQPNAGPRLVSHFWTLAHVDGKWLHLDALEGGKAGADRLVVSTTNLSGPDEYGALELLLDTLGKTDFQIMGTKY